MEGVINPFNKDCLIQMTSIKRVYASDIKYWRFKKINIAFAINCIITRCVVKLCCRLCAAEIIL